MKTSSLPLAALALLSILIAPGAVIAAGQHDAGKPAGASERARIKQEAARDRLRELEEAMDRLARILATTGPRNAQKLRTAFQISRERLLREGMESVLKFLKEKKLGRAVEDQAVIVRNLQDLLDILLEKDIDPRALIRHIKRVKAVLKDLDKIVEEETAEKLTSDRAAAAESPAARISAALVEVDELVRKQKEIESRLETDGTSKADMLTKSQEEVRRSTEALRKSGAEGGDNGSTGLDSKSLAAAEAAMKSAAKSMRGGDGDSAKKNAAAARKKLEAARVLAEKKLDEQRSRRDFPRMKKDQDGTLGRTRDVLERMKKTPPLVYSPGGGIPGRGDVAGASDSMEGASGSLSGDRPRSASRSQEEALNRLNEGRRKVEETLETLQRALRERLLVYLRERFTFMLEKQRRVSRQTRSLDNRLRALAAVKLSLSNPSASDASDVTAGIDRKDLQKAEGLSRRERSLAVVAEDIIDLLEEDGTTLVLPRIVGELHGDLDNVRGRLAKVRTGELTQRIQKEIEDTLAEILEAIKEAQKSPPPPSPNSGRQSSSGAGPLLPTSAELKMIRSMQVRVNRRTQDFDLDRHSAELGVEGERQSQVIADRQQEIEDLLRKVARGL